MAQSCRSFRLVPQLVLVSTVTVVVVFAGAEASAQTMRDSAGIRIVENARPAWRAGQEWRVPATPIVDIGGSGGANYEFGRIADVVRLSDGRIVAADAQAYQLRFYDATGQHLKSVGRKGEGPGEFAELTSVSRLAGDTLAVDARRGASLFVGDGTFIRTIRFGPFPAGALQTPFAVALGRFDDGTTIVADYPQGRRQRAGATRWVDSATMFLLNGSGAIVRPLGTTPAVIFQAGAARPSPITFGPELSFTSSGRSMYLGFSDRYSIGVYGSDWTLQRIIRRPWTPKPITGSDLDAYVDGWAKMWIKSTGAAAEKERTELREGGYPDQLPAFATLLASPAGELWVREPSLAGAPGCWCTAGLSDMPSRWSVFDASGRWLGDVALPSRFTPKEIGADYVLGIGRDADDVPHVLMYRIEKPS